MYKYLNVRFDSKYSQYIDTVHVVNILSQIDDLERAEKLQFKNKQDEPWGVVNLVKCDDRGCYGFTKDDYFEKINLVEFIFSDDQESFNYYLKIARQVANLISWEVADDETGVVLNKK